MHIDSVLPLTADLWAEVHRTADTEAGKVPTAAAAGSVIIESGRQNNLASKSVGHQRVCRIIYRPRLEVRKEALSFTEATRPVTFSTILPSTFTGQLRQRTRCLSKCPTA
jgi:hypothetical protein